MLVVKFFDGLVSISKFLVRTSTGLRQREHNLFATTTTNQHKTKPQHPQGKRVFSDLIAPNLLGH